MLLITGEGQWTPAIGLEAFLIEYKAQSLAQGTIGFSRLKLGNFADFCQSQAISQINQIDPNTFRNFLMLLAHDGHIPGGIAAHYWAIRTFLDWWEDEIKITRKIVCSDIRTFPIVIS